MGDDSSVGGLDGGKYALRVLLLAQWYEPIIGGEEIQVRTLAHGLAQRGHRVSVVALDHPDRPADYWDGDVHVYRVRATVQHLPMIFKDGARQSAPPFPDPNVARHLRRIVRRERPDIVHAHNWIVHSYVPVRDSRIPLVVTLHDHSMSCAKKIFLYQGAVCSGPAPLKCLRCAAGHYGAVKGSVTLGGLWGSREALLRSTDCFVGVSHAVIDASLPKNRTSRRAVVPNFLPDDFTASAGALPDGLPSSPYILFVGSLAATKGVDVLIDAHGRLRPDTRPPLVLLGYTGSERLDVLGRLAPDVTVITDQPRSQVAAAWRGSLFGVIPSVGPEAFGLVALEAMAMGRPVIASHIGGLPEVVEDGSTGLLVSPGDARALATALERLIGDGQLRRSMGTAATARAREYSAESVVPRIVRLYGDLVTSRRTASAGPSASA